MNTYVVGGTSQQAVDWIRHRGWGKASGVVALSNTEYFFRGQANFIVVLVGTYWNRADARNTFDLIATRPGMFVVDETVRYHKVSA